MIVYLVDEDVTILYEQQLLVRETATPRQDEDEESKQEKQKQKRDPASLQALVDALGLFL